VGAALAYLACLALAYGLLLPAQPASPGREPIPPGQALLLVAALNTAVMAWLILRAPLRGWALAGALTAVFYGVQTFLPQVESLIFQTSAGYAAHLPAAVIPRLFAAGLLHACLWVPLAVLILGRWKGPVPEGPADPAPSRDWRWQVPLAALAYVVLYFTFGYYVAWRSPAVTAYYQGTDPGTFWLGMRDVFRDTPWLPPAQFLRGLVWTALAILILRTVTGSVLEKALAVAAFFAIALSSGLLLPNPYMPYPVRMAHLLETASSDFLFGALAAWMFGRAPASARP
jgi:hypothetical protein